MAICSVEQTGLARCRYVTASVYQMLRGAEILFSAIFAVTFLKRPLNKLHYGGIAGCLAGICLVGASSLLSPGSGGSSQAGMVLLGMALIVVAQVGPPQEALRYTPETMRPLAADVLAAHRIAAKAGAAKVVLRQGSLLLSLGAGMPA